MLKKNYFIFFFFIIPVFLFSAGTNEGLAAANAAYESGDFNQALSLYENAEIDTPESPYIYFNKGLTFFRMEDYEKAKAAFLSAASKTKDLQLEARAYYNLGNTAFFEAGRQVESDLEKAIKLYQEAITNYQIALERDDTLTDPAHNIEVTRLIVRDLLDKLKKQQEQNAEQQEKIEEIVKKLAELIEREAHEIELTQSLKEEKENKGVSASLRNNAGKIKKEQEQIRKETMEVSGKLDELMPQGAQAPEAAQFKTAKEHVDLSVNYQHLSENQLQKIDMANALESEGKAREELIKAIEALAKPEDQQNQDQQQEQKDEEQQKQEEEMKEQAKDADDIIDEEQEEKREREMQGQAGYRGVDRDW